MTYLTTTREPSFALIALIYWTILHSPLNSTTAKNLTGILS